MKAPTVAINAICWWPQQLVSRQSAILSALYYSFFSTVRPQGLNKKKIPPSFPQSLIWFAFSSATRRSRQKNLAPENSLTDSPPAAAFFTLYVCARNFLLQFLQQKKPSPFGSPTNSSASSLHQQSAPFWSEEAMQRENSQFPHKKNSTPTTTMSDAHAPCPTNPAHATKKTKTRSSRFLDNTKSTTGVDFRTIERDWMSGWPSPPATERTKKRNSKLKVLKSSVFKDFQ